MDPSRLTKGERTLLLASLALFVLSFVPFWAKYEFTGAMAIRTNLWSSVFSFLPRLAIVLVILASGLALVKALGTNVDLPTSHGRLYAGLAGLAAVLLLLTLLVGPAEARFSGPGFEISRGPLLVVGWIIAAAAAYGGYLHMQEEGEAPGTSSPSATPPPAS